MNGVEWTVHPIAFSIGKFSIAWYGILFGAMLFTAFHVWEWQTRRGGYSQKFSGDFYLTGAIGLVIGARLFHVLFYEPERYLANPLKILNLREGGLASHGSITALFVVILFFAWKYKRNALDIFDRVAMCGPVAMIFVRLGNLVNHEIVGRPTDAPWAFIFMRHPEGPGQPPIPRHPSQLYEAILGVIIGLIMLGADRLAGREQRRVGMMSGLFLTLYTLGRIYLEQFKEFQHKEWEGLLTMGQWLSLPYLVVGAGFLAWAFMRGPRAADTVPKEREA
ncbi:MAG: Prolipoprotein diacylglyceryl transferase [Myxococcota bacterium]|nr:Prolipoprotein diacylglyceryl transferase [Myxococcota bacterium]